MRRSSFVPCGLIVAVLMVVRLLHLHTSNVNFDHDASRLYAPARVVDPWIEAELATWSSMPQTSSPLALCFSGRFCVAPALQVESKWRVGFFDCVKTRGWRFKRTMMSGFDQHPAIVSSTADVKPHVTFWMPTCAPKQENVTKERLVVLDEADKPGNWRVRVPADRAVAYFKRSWVGKRNGSHDSAGGRAESHRDTDALTFFPLQYPVWDNYTHALRVGSPRPLAVVCTLRTSDAKQPARTRVSRWLREELENRTDVFVGDTGGHRKKIDTSYFDLMRSAKIVVTALPSFWDGDFRLLEALSSGALVMVDELHTPSAYPLVDGEHLVVYDSHDKRDFILKLRYYQNHPDLAAAIATKGLHHVLTHHRAVSRVDYILRSIHQLYHDQHFRDEEEDDHSMKKSRKKNRKFVFPTDQPLPPLPSNPYTETAMHIRDSHDHQTHRQFCFRQGATILRTECR